MGKKILALLLICVLAVSMLSSCGTNSDELNMQIIEAAETALKGGVYSATSDVTYTSASEGDLANAIQTVTNSQTIYSVNGDDFITYTNLVVDGVNVEKSYVVKDGVLYSRSKLVVAGQETVICEKANLDATLLAATIEEIGPGVKLGYGDFEVHEGKGDLTACTITCANLKAESLSGVEKILGVYFADDTSSFSLSGATLVIEIKEGKYESVSLTLDYYAMVNGAMYKMSTTMVTTYEYTGDVSVSAPANADEYGLVDYEKIFN